MNNLDIGYIGCNNTDYTERQPCYFVKFECKDDRNTSLWKIGIVKEGKTSETKIKCKTYGDVEDDNFWNIIQSKSFILDLLNAYKVNESYMRKWLKEQF